MMRLILLALLSVCSIKLLASEIRDTQDELMAWIEAEKAIAQTRSEWTAEKAIVEDLVALLSDKKETFELEIEKLSKGDSQTDKLRTQLNADREKLKAASEALLEMVPSLEDQTRALLVRLPKPLLEELAPLVRRLPESGSKTKIPVSQRLLTVVGILNKVDKFNQDIVTVSEVREIDGGTAEVTTLYFGLAAAYFANDAGTYGGVGKAGADGWTWQNTPEHAEDIADLIASYKGTREASFVSLPVSIQ